MKKSLDNFVSGIRLALIITAGMFAVGCAQEAAPPKTNPSTTPAQETMMNGDGMMKGEGMKDGAMMKDEGMMKDGEKMKADEKM